MDVEVHPLVPSSPPSRGDDRRKRSRSFMFAFDNGLRSPRKLLGDEVRRFIAALRR
jgi:hypothetical protein